MVTRPTSNQQQSTRRAHVSRTCHSIFLHAIKIHLSKFHSNGWTQQSRVDTHFVPGFLEPTVQCRFSVLGPGVRGVGKSYRVLGGQTTDSTVPGVPGSHKTAGVPGSPGKAGGPVVPGKKKLWGPKVGKCAALCCRVGVRTRLKNGTNDVQSYSESSGVAASPGASILGSRGPGDGRGAD